VLFELGVLRGRVNRADAVDAFGQAVAAAPEQWTRVDATTHLAATLLVEAQNERAMAVLQRLADTEELSGDQAVLVHGMLLGCAYLTGATDVHRRAMANIPPDLPGDTPAQRLALSLLVAQQFDTTDRSELVARALRCYDGNGKTPFGEYGLTVFDPVPTLISLGAFDELERLAAARIAFARDTGDEGMFVLGQCALAAAAQLRGRWKVAEGIARGVLDQPDLRVDHRFTAGECLFEALIRQQRFDEARAVLEWLSPSFPVRQWADLKQAMLDEASGEHTAFERFKSFAEFTFEMGMRSTAARRWLCSYADGLIHHGRSDDARALMEEYLRDSEASGLSAPIGHALTVLGRCTRGDEALAYLERAVAVLAPSPHEWLHGWARCELGAALRRDNRRADAREHLRIALEYAEEHGERKLEARVREELRLAGGRTRRAVVDRDALTPAEERVARLAAAGHSNKQIAADLFVTVGTVQTTLVKIYRKLGVDSRHKLGDALAQRDGVRAGAGPDGSQ